MLDAYRPLFDLGWHLHVVLTTAFSALAVSIGCSVRRFLIENPGPERPKGAWLCLASDIASKAFLVVAATGVITMSLQLTLYLPSSAESEPSDLATMLTSELQTLFLNGALDDDSAKATIDRHLGTIPDSTSLHIAVSLPSALSFLVVCDSSSDAAACEVHSNSTVDREPDFRRLDGPLRPMDPLASTLKRLASSPSGLTAQNTTEAVLEAIGPLEDYAHLDFRLVELPQNHFHCEPDLSPGCRTNW